MKGPKLSGNISGTDPLKDNRLLLKAEALDDTDDAKHTAAVVNELSKEISRILVSHPLNAKRAAEGKNIANVVLLRGCGIRIEVSLFRLDIDLNMYKLDVIKFLCLDPVLCTDAYPAFFYVYYIILRCHWANII